MAIAYVGTAVSSGSNNGGATTIACGARTVIAGNLLVVIVGNETGGPVYASGIADSAGNTYTYIGRTSSSGDSVEMWYAKNITGYTNNIVTATFGASATYRRIACMEFSGCDTTAPFTAGEYNTGASASGAELATGTFATAVADSVIVYGGFHGTAHSFTPGTDGVTGHTFTETYDAADYYCNAGYYIEASTGSGYKGQTTAPGSANWSIVAAAFKILPAGGYTLACDGGSYSITGQDATPKRDGKVVPEAGNYTLTGQVAGIYYGRAIDADAGVYVLTGTAASLLRAAKIVPEAGAYALTGAEAFTLYGRAIDADAGAYVVMGTDAALLRAARLALDAGAYTITGQDAALIRAAKLVLDAGAYVLTGQAVTLTYVPGAGAYILSCESGTYAIAGQDAAALIDRLLSAGAGAYVIAGQDAALFRAVVNSILLYSRIKRTVDLESSRAPSVDLQSEFTTEVGSHSRIDRD